MQKILLLLAIAIGSEVSGQDMTSTPYKFYYEYDQEYGLHKERGVYTLNVKYSEDTLKWRADKTYDFEATSIITKTDKYVVGLSKDSTYVFYSIGESRLFYLMKWESSYAAYGVGQGPFALRETVGHMIHVVKNGGNAEDVVAFLCKQEDYDF